MLGLRSRRLYLEESLCPAMSCHGASVGYSLGAARKCGPLVLVLEQLRHTRTKYRSGKTNAIIKIKNTGESDGWIVGLVFWYAVKMMQQHQHRAAQRRRSTAGTRLLRKSSSSSTGGSRLSWSSTASAFAGRKPKTH
jgi:hypothetical protein